MGPTTKLLRTQSDERLVALAQAGHEAAFEAIVERYRRPLLRAGRRVLPESRAEDAVQQAFLAAWRALRRGDEVRELRPWLYRIMQNTALNALRLRGYDHAELEESLRVSDAPQDEIERRDVMRRTLSGLAALPDRQREALLRTAVDGRSQAEVAAAMGLTDGAVRQLVHRARHSLRTAATALVPFPAVVWVASASTRGPIPERMAELVAGAGGAGTTAVLAKAGTVAVVAGTAVGGGVALKHREPPEPARAAEVRLQEADRKGSRDRATVSDAAAIEQENGARPERRAAAQRERREHGERSRGGDEERTARTEPRRATSRRGSSPGSGDDDDDLRSGRDDDEADDDRLDDDSGSDDGGDELGDVDESDDSDDSGSDDDVEELEAPDDGSDDALDSSSGTDGSDSDPELDD